MTATGLNPASPRFALIAASLAAVAPVMAQAESPVEGIWSAVVTTRDRQEWSAADLLCGLWCSPSFYDHIQALIDDPRNDGIPTRTLRQQALDADRQRFAEAMTQAGRERTDSQQPADLSAVCVEPSLLEAAIAPLPVLIDVQSNRIVLQQEYWNLKRTIPLAGASGASESPFGQSVAHFEGDTLVIETQGAPPMSLAGIIETTDEATVTERYRPRPDGSRLDILFTIDDPGIFLEPQTLQSPRLRAADVELDQYDSCSALEGSGR